MSTFTNIYEWAVNWYVYVILVAYVSGVCRFKYIHLLIHIYLIFVHLQFMCKWQNNINETSLRTCTVLDSEYIPIDIPVEMCGTTGASGEGSMEKVLSVQAQWLGLWSPAPRLGVVEGICYPNSDRMETFWPHNLAQTADSDFSKRSSLKR